MKIKLIAMGNRMPAWVTQSSNYYIKQLPHDYQLSCAEIALTKRGKNCDIKRIVTREGEQMLSALVKDAETIALDVKGESWSTEQLAQHLSDWHEAGRNLNLLIGGPEGLAPQCLQQSNRRLSLSKLTLPHPLVRVIISEQIYRAWSIIANHPYHRA